MARKLLAAALVLLFVVGLLAAAVPSGTATAAPLGSPHPSSASSTHFGTAGGAPSVSVTALAQQRHLKVPPAPKPITLPGAGTTPHAGKIHPFPALKQAKQAKHVNPKEVDYGPCSDAFPCGSGDLSYFNGPVQEYPAAYLIFWGPSWTSGSGLAAQQTVTNYFQDMGGSGFENTATQYFDNNQQIAHSLAFGGVYVDTSTPPSETTNCGGVPAVDEQSYINEVQVAESAKGWSNDPNNATYFVYTPAGYASYEPGGGCSTLGGGNYCAFHNYWYGGGGPSYAFGVMPWPDHDGVLFSSFCPAMETPNGNSAGDSLSGLSSHEQTEAMTDPQVGSGWVDNVGYEIGDKCAWIDNGDTGLNGGGTFSLQPEYSNYGHACLNFSRSFYFAEGFTGGSFTTYLTLANPTGNVAHVAVEYLLGGGGAIVSTYALNPTSRTTVNVNSTVGTGQNVSMVVFADQAIVAERPEYFTYHGLVTPIPGGTDVVGAPTLGTGFAFGYVDTTTDHSTFLTILNPNVSTMTADVYYLAAGGGGTYGPYVHTVNPISRGTIGVGAESGLPSGSYSALVFLSTLGMVERPLYEVDDYTGYTGAADVLGSTALAKAWGFAEGFTNSNFSERYIISNPLSGSPASVIISFYLPNGTTPTASFTVPAGGQYVLNVNSVLGNGVNNSAVVESNQYVIAERFMSFDYHGPLGCCSHSNIPGTTDVVGTTGPSQVFYFAEGTTTGNFAEYLTLENFASSSTTVVVAYLPAGGGSPTDVTYTVGANTRYTINTASAMPSQSFSMVVLASQSIVAERPMYFQYAGSQTGGTDVIGFYPIGAA